LQVGCTSLLVCCVLPATCHLDGVWVPGISPGRSCVPACYRYHSLDSGGSCTAVWILSGHCRYTGFPAVSCHFWVSLLECTGSRFHTFRFLRCKLDASACTCLHLVPSQITCLGLPACWVYRFWMPACLLPGCTTTVYRSAWVHLPACLHLAWVGGCLGALPGCRFWVPAGLGVGTCCLPAAMPPVLESCCACRLL